MLDTVLVSSVMTPDPQTVPQDMTVQALMERINANDPAYTRHQALLIVDGEGNLCGIITRGDLLKALQDGNTECPVLQAGTRDVTVAYPDDSVRDALNRALKQDIGRLPVVARENPLKIVGYLSRGNMISAHLSNLADETHIESGWLQDRILTRFSGR